MNKPTLFFSHSSKDKDMVLAIKNKVMKYTSNTLEIFQSSDGESIPFGTNWIHKVEEGLNDAKVMFVFVTEQSLSSGWIYFEAGYAYSKSIHVIPVGMGISIGALKPPLNLLQGFNITSGDSLNNFMTIINREFNVGFADQFTEEDYTEIMSLSSSGQLSAFRFEEIVRSVRFVIEESANRQESELDIQQTEEIFDQIKTYLDEKDIAYSYTPMHGYGYDKGSMIAVQGIKFVYSLGTQGDPTGELTVNISPYNFEKSFQLYLDISKQFKQITSFYLQLTLKDRYSYVIEDEDCAAILSMSDWFTLSKNPVGSFECARLNLSFSIYNLYGSLSPEYVLGIGYKPENINIDSIKTLVAKLVEMKVIYPSIGGSQNA